MTGQSGTRDLSRAVESTQCQKERIKGSNKVDNKTSNSRRKPATLGTPLLLSDTSNTPTKASQRTKKPTEQVIPSTLRKPSFREFGYSNAGGAGSSNSLYEDPLSKSSYESSDITKNLEDKHGQGRIVPSESQNDKSLCSSYESILPFSLNSKLIEMKLRPEQIIRATSNDKHLHHVNSNRKSSHSSNFNRAFSMSSNSGTQRDLGNRVRSGKDVSGLVGLINEGNTCYLNSCLQCLAHSMPLASAVQGPIERLLERRGSGTQAGTSERNWSNLAELLAYSFRQVVRDLWQQPAFTTTSPRMFLKCVQAWAPQFAGHSQHDTQEVLRAILDGLHEALNRVTSAPPYRDLYLEPTPEEELAELTWRYHKLCQDSIIQDIFCGKSLLLRENKRFILPFSTKEAWNDFNDCVLEFVVSFVP